MSTERDVTRLLSENELYSIEFALRPQSTVQVPDDDVRQLVAIARYALTLTEELEKLRDRFVTCRDLVNPNTIDLRARGQRDIYEMIVRWLDALLSSSAERPTDDKERIRDFVSWLQRYQPAGSPPPGDWVILARWIVMSLAEQAASPAGRHSEDRPRSVPLPVYERASGDSNGPWLIRCRETGHEAQLILPRRSALKPAANAPGGENSDTPA